MDPIAGTKRSFADFYPEASCTGSGTRRRL